MRKIRLALTLTIAAIISPRQAFADPVQIGLIFTVQQSVGSRDFFGVPLEPGSVFTGHFSYDPSAPDVLPSDPATGQYQLNGSISFDVGIGLQALLSTAVENDEYCQDPCDIFHGSATPSIEGFYPNTLFYFVLGAPSSAFNNDALPQTSAAFLGAFRGPGTFRLAADKIGVNEESYTNELMGLVQTEGSAVPEPATLVLMATGLVGIVRARRRRSRTCSVAE